MPTPAATRSTQIAAWLARGGQDGQGGLVLAANERTARALTSAFNAAQRAAGLTAWPTPSIFSWDSWLHQQWQPLNSAGLLTLNPVQELALWTRVIDSSAAAQQLHHTSRLAAQAQRAWRLLLAYAPQALDFIPTFNWSGGSAVFAAWARDFDRLCRATDLTTAARIPHLLTAALLSNSAPRPPLLLIGFDRLLPAQKQLLDAWGPAEHLEPASLVQQTHFFAAREEASKLAACARWLRARLTQDPSARLIVVTTQLDQTRGHLQRALMRHTPAEPDLSFEFSLGVPLAQVGLVRSALLLFRWLSQPLTEAELDWLIASAHTALTPTEELALAETMLALRRHNLERLDWSLAAFLDPPILWDDDENSTRKSPRPPSTWADRLRAALLHLQSLPPRQSPIDWADAARDLLDLLAWPGYRPLTSPAFQAKSTWDDALQACASLAYDGRLISWPEFVSAARDSVAATIFATESAVPPILVTGPAESAGLLADGIWFLGLSEDNWPGRGSPHPFLPIAVQREAAMPHATPQDDWEIAEIVTKRILASAPEVIFSFPQRVPEGEARPSRLIARLAGQPAALPAELAPPPDAPPATETFDDTSRIPYPLSTLEGGANTLTTQSLCAFRAFASVRLGAESWSPAEAGLNASQRGLLLHAVLHKVWAGRQRGGLTTLDDLRQLPDLPAFVRRIVDAVLGRRVNQALRETLPPRFLDLEAQRLTALVTRWLQYEATRQNFHVLHTELKRQVTVAGLSMTVRLDRVDVVQQPATLGSENTPETTLILDYKTGSVSPSAWSGDRPDDIQLPLYATHAALLEDLPQSNGLVEGILFARVKPGDEMGFYGRVRNAAQTLLADIGNRSALATNPLDNAQLDSWRQVIERLGHEFLHGHAEVAPKNDLKTCEHCGLFSICRIHQNLRPEDLDSDQEEDQEDENA